jgi:hypothetical protein
VAEAIHGDEGALVDEGVGGKIGAFDRNKKTRQSMLLCLSQKVGLKVDYPAEFSIRLG